MKTTIRINGLDVEFTDQKPTKPGVYWHQMDNHPVPYVITVTEKHGVYAVDQLHVYKGLWSAPLVPATEVEKAAHELWCEAAGGTCGTPQEWRADWINSNARRVVEGE